MSILRPAPLFLSLLLAACLPAHMSGTGRGTSESVRSQYETARAKATAGDHVQAAELYEDLAQRYPRSDEADEALYGAGLAWEAAQQRMRARAAYERLLSAYPNSDKAQLAKDRLVALGPASALDEARQHYATLPEHERYAAATRYAEQAEAQGLGAEALHWRGEAVAVADSAQRLLAEDRLAGLIDRLSALDVETLAEQADPQSAAAPLLVYRLAQVHQERRNWEDLEDTLSRFLRRWPEHPLAPSAEELLRKIERRGEVYPDRIGVVLPLSGSHRAFGQQVLDGIEFALRGAGFSIVVRDSQGEAAIAEAETERLFYEDHVMAIVGGVLHAEAEAIAAKADELGVPLITFSPTSEIAQNSEWVFRDMLTNDEVVKAVVDFAMDQHGFERFAVLRPEIPYGEELEALFEAQVLERGGVVEKRESYESGATSFTEPIKRMVGRDEPENHPEYHHRLAEIRAQNLDARRRRNAIEKMRQSLSPLVDFDAIFIPDQWRTVSLIAPALAFEDVITAWCDEREVDRVRRTTGQRVRPVMLLGVNLWNHPELPTRAGRYINCSVFVDGFFAGSAREETIAFVEAYAAWKGRAPAMLEAYGSEAASLLRYVLVQEMPQTRRQLRDRLSEASDVPGPMGPTSVKENGDVVHPLFVLVVDRGEIREVEFLGVDDETDVSP